MALSDEEKYKRLWLDNGYLRPRYNHDYRKRGVVQSYKDWFLSMRIQTRKQVELLHTQLVRKGRASIPISYYASLRDEFFFIYAQYYISSISISPYNKDSWHDLGLNQYFTGQNPYDYYVGSLNGLDQGELFIKSSLIYHEMGQGLKLYIPKESNKPPFERWIPLNLDYMNNKFMPRNHQALEFLMKNHPTGVFYCCNNPYTKLIPVKQLGTRVELAEGPEFRLSKEVISVGANPYHLGTANLLFRGDNQFQSSSQHALRPIIMTGEVVYFKERGFLGWVKGGTMVGKYGGGSGSIHHQGSRSRQMELEDMFGEFEIEVDIFGNEKEVEVPKKWFPEDGLASGSKLESVEFGKIAFASFFPLFNVKHPYHPIERFDRWLNYWQKCYSITHNPPEEKWYKSFLRFMLQTLAIATMMFNPVSAAAYIVSSILETAAEIVDSESLSKFLLTLKTVVNVAAIVYSVTDITKTYFQGQAQIKNLEAGVKSGKVGMVEATKEISKIQTVTPTLSAVAQNIASSIQKINREFKQLELRLNLEDLKDEVLNEDGTAKKLDAKAKLPSIKTEDLVSTSKE